MLTTLLLRLHRATIIFNSVENQPNVIMLGSFAWKINGMDRKFKNENVFQTAIKLQATYYAWRRNKKKWIDAPYLLCW